MMLTTPPKIDLLPEHLIDQIKAGEVIERPGNLLKEILENAIDAGATKLELHLKNNGLDLISLKDNGHGMRFEDLPLAFSRHATSKISRFEDLYRLRSFGFRGEALASISAISRLQCLSATPGAEVGSEIRIEGAQTVYHGRRRSTGQGTELVIQDLFFNTPARLKFIQSQSAEKQFIKKIIYAFILSNPMIEFQVKFDDDEKELFPAAENLEARIAEIVPRSKDLILKSERYYDNYELELTLVPGSIRAPIKWQYVFINNRYVLDKQLHRVICNALEANFGSDDFHFIASLSLPADAIDVNVHPSKTVIKLLESSKLIGLLTATIKELSQQKRTTPVEAPTPSPLPQNLTMGLDGTGPAPMLAQERHAYNLEGQFSPHGLLEPKQFPIAWISGGFFLKELGSQIYAFSAKRLLEKYVRAKLAAPASSVPLLVSEPFPAKGVDDELLRRFGEGGLELERMGADTIVLRSIPDWMNGFPLREIITLLLQQKDFSTLEVQERDWSSSTWEELGHFFPIDELLRDRVALDLAALLKERLK